MAELLSSKAASSVPLLQPSMDLIHGLQCPRWQVHRHRKITMEVITNLTCTVRPALFIRSAFHPGNWFARQSMIGWIWAFVSFLTDKGKTRYLQGNSRISHGICCCTKSNSSVVQRIGGDAALLNIRFQPRSCAKYP